MDKIITWAVYFHFNQSANQLWNESLLNYALSPVLSSGRKYPKSIVQFCPLGNLTWTHPRQLENQTGWDAIKRENVKWKGYKCFKGLKGVAPAEREREFWRKRIAFLSALSTFSALSYHIVNAYRWEKPKDASSVFQGMWLSSQLLAASNFIAFIFAYFLFLVLFSKQSLTL